MLVKYKYDTIFNTTDVPRPYLNEKTYPQGDTKDTKANNLNKYTTTQRIRLTTASLCFLTSFIPKTLTHTMITMIYDFLMTHTHTWTRSLCVCVPGSNQKSHNRTHLPEYEISNKQTNVY